MEECLQTCEVMQDAENSFNLEKIRAVDAFIMAIAEKNYDIYAVKCAVEAADKITDFFANLSPRTEQEAVKTLKEIFHYYEIFLTRP